MLTHNEIKRRLEAVITTLDDLAVKHQVKAVVEDQRNAPHTAEHQRDLSSLYKEHVTDLRAALDVIMHHDAWPIRPDSDFAKAMLLVQAERIRQDGKWGTVKERPHSLPGWLLIIEQELKEAKDAWAGIPGNDSCFEEIIHVTATGVAVIEQYIGEKNARNRQVEPTGKV
jgi:hypothetical protein